MVAQQRDLPATPNVPALYCPIAPYLHPRAAQIDDKASAWMSTQAIPEDPSARERLLRSKCSYLISNCSPRAHVDRLEAGGKWTYLGFAYDDWFESRASLDEIIAVSCALQRVQEAPRSELTDVPFLSAFIDVMSDLRRFATPTQYKRFSNRNRAYFQALPWEASYRLRGDAPDLNTNVAIRLDVAGAAFLEIMEICNGEEIPSAEFDRPAFQAIGEMTTLLQAWVNDLCSVPKDAHDGGGANNIVFCLQRERKCSLEDATAEVVAMWNRIMLRFEELRGGMTADGSPQLGRFLDDCGRAVGNIAAWHAHNPRYDTPPLSVVADAPTDLDPSPLDIPSISWWWQELD
jgi:hypothetical protein